MDEKRKESVLNLIAATACGDVQTIEALAAANPDFDAFAREAFDFVADPATFREASDAAEVVSNTNFYYCPTRSSVPARLLAPDSGSFSSRAAGVKRYARQAQALKAMLDAGWTPSEEEASAIVVSSASSKTAGFLHALAVSGVFAKKLDGLAAMNFVFHLRDRADLPLACEALEALARFGANPIDDPAFGPTDFASVGALGAARFMHSMGYAISDVKISGRYIHPGMPPVCAVAMHSGANAYLSGAGDTPELEALRDEESDAVVATLEWLNGEGVDFNPPNDGARPSGSPLRYSLMEARSRGWERFARASRKLAELGSDPNSEAFPLLPYAISKEAWNRGTFATDLSIELGAKAKGCSGEALAALCRYDDGKAAVARAKELLADPRLGFDLSEISATGAVGANPFASAVRMRRYPLARHFMSLGFPIDWEDGGTSCLHHLALSSGKPAFALLSELLSMPKFLAQLEKASGPDDEEVESGLTPLQLACAGANVEAARLLLGAGANPSAADGLGRTPMHHLSRKYGQKSKDKILPLLELLLEKGADPAAKDAKGRTPLQLLAKKSPLPAIAKLAVGAAQDLLGETPEAKAAAAAMSKRADWPFAEELLLNLDAETQNSAPARRRSSSL